MYWVERLVQLHCRSAAVSNFWDFARPGACLKAWKFKSLFTLLGGRHAMALTVDGKVFSWGEGDDGKLGHFSRM